MKPQLIKGVVKKFNGNGRKFGYPTANIETDTQLGDGVYFGFADLGKYKKHPALIFIGTPETVGDKERRVEAYLLDIPDIDYYSLSLELDIRYFYRPTKKFDSINKLLKAMKTDEQAARKWFKNSK